MSPKSPRTTPYSRRASTQPKSSRQQFSACGACRMRRVRCDLKDLPVSAVPSIACSNCRERGLKCVDEFADVKAVKLLRRGRRLQQVEALYGKVTDEDSPPCSSPSDLAAVHSQPQGSTIPHLNPDLFHSRFWRRFCMQRPILTDFPARYFAHLKGSAPLTSDGRLLAMVLVAWATSFGLDESGAEMDHEDSSTASVPPISSSASTMSMRTRRQAERALAPAPAPINTRHPHEKSRTLRARTSKMVREILAHIDSAGVLRRPTWDGVRVLLLLLTIADDVQTPLERLSMYETAMAQVYTLSGLASLSQSSPPSNISPEVEPEIRARVFWYVHVYEGVSAGLRGGRLTFDEDELDAFQSSLPFEPLPTIIPSSTPASLPSPVSPTFPGNSLSPSPGLPYHMQQHAMHQNQQMASLQHLPAGVYHQSEHTRHFGPSQATQPTNLLSAHLFSLPLHLSSVCRRAHALLTGPKARRLTNERSGIDEKGMRAIWDGLDNCWDEFEALRREGAGGAMGVGTGDDVERFVGAWQIFIFECHNVIREALKRRIVSHPPVPATGICSPNGATHSAPSPSRSQHSSRSSHSSYPPSPVNATFAVTANGPSTIIHHLHAASRHKCNALLPHVLSIMKRHLQWKSEHPDGEKGTGLFGWDAGLVRDGCFFAGYLVAGGEREALGGEYDSIEREERSFDPEEGMDICMKALTGMRWAFSKTEERERTLRMVWESNERRPGSRSMALPYAHAQTHEGTLDDEAYELHSRMYPDPPSSAPYNRIGHTLPLMAPTSTADRPLLPPLAMLNGANVETTHRVPQPSTWATYTPPGTASTTPGSPVSYHALTTPSVAALGGYKSEVDFYAHHDLDPFNYSPPVVSATATDSDPTNASGAIYSLRHDQHHQHHQHHPHHRSAGMHTPNSYLDPTVVFSAEDSSEDGCAQFSSDCHGYHY